MSGETKRAWLTAMSRSGRACPVLLNNALAAIQNGDSDAEVDHTLLELERHARESLILASANAPVSAAARAAYQNEK